MEDKIFPAWSKTVEECLEEYDVSLENGLNSHEVEKHRQIYGWNELQKKNGTPLWKLVVEQFDDTVVKILLLAAGISFLLAYFRDNVSSEEGITAYVEPLVILLILILNAIVGVWQENNSEKALEALKEMQSDHAKVLRDGHYVVDLPSRELVPGDIVELKVGDKVPADMRIVSLKTSTFRMEQSSLTRESMPVVKRTYPATLCDCELQSKACMVFAGTTVTNGCCTCIVVSTGMFTEIGKIQAQIQEASMECHDTPLKRKLDEFGERLTTVIGAICILVWIMNYKYFLSWEVIDGWPKKYQVFL